MVVIEGITLANIPTANPAVMSKNGVGKGMVLVNCNTGAAITINRTGALIWTLIDGKRNAEEIADAVRRSFKNLPDTVRDDVESLLITLAEDGFIGYEVKNLTKITGNDLQKPEG